MHSFEPVAVEPVVDGGMASTSSSFSTSTSRSHSRSHPRTPRRDRRGRGLRGPLLPAGLPGARTRQEQFAEHVEAAASRLAEVCGPSVDRASFRATMVPDDLEYRLDQFRVWGAELADDPTGSVRRGPDGTAIITIHRRPIEARCPSPSMLPDLVYSSVVEQWASLTGMAPEAVDPDYHW
ncbi:metallopeptidase family protein [Citricoccus sp. GCM10030269]|uniref:metallopeptidase family protein n=1 Tax=Citricoccus sp. GCM10030269 TaxID=3273388 RepID=UPI00360BEC3C